MLVLNIMFYFLSNLNNGLVPANFTKDKFTNIDIFTKFTNSVIKKSYFNINQYFPFNIFDVLKSYFSIFADSKNINFNTLINYASKNIIKISFVFYCAFSNKQSIKKISCLHG